VKPRPWLIALPFALGCVPGKAGNGLQCVASDAIDPMEQQAKYDPYERSRFFSDGRAMRRPPAGTVAREAPPATGLEATGLVDGGYATSIPLVLTRSMLDRGRDRFDIYCAACHGIVGDGVSVVAAKMELRPPPSLVGGDAATFPPGRVFQVATEGYGLMPSYRAQLTLEDRWAVVAYVHALVESQNARVASAPTGVQQQLGAR
jgi:mono/diheme cytochrome c family protein